MTIRPLIITAALCLAMPAQAQTAAPSLKTQVEVVLAKAPAGTRFGLLVVDEAGREVLAVNPDGRFIPASNTKLFTTAAAMALLGDTAAPDAASGAQVELAPRAGGAADVWLSGRGDARLSSAADCKADCLTELADAVAKRTRKVHDVIGDDSFFPDQRWSPGMSWNNFGSNDATAASALTLDSNEALLAVTPGKAGAPPVVAIPAYFTLINEAVTVPAGGKTTLAYEHRLNSREFRLYGEIAEGGTEWRERIGIDDPADYAAWSLRRMLEARGVKVQGQVRVVHRAVQNWDDPAWRAAHLAPDVQKAEPTDQSKADWVIVSAGGVAAEPLARTTPGPLVEDVALINKVSQNLHAELLLRRIGRHAGTGSLEDGLAAARNLFEKAGIPRAGFDFSDGSGMSTYNRVSPRAGVALLRWGSQQPWGDAWIAGFPIGGVDGTLRRRFAGTVLEGKIQAKTGTLNATNALSGFLTAASGRRLTFSMFANDVPNGSSALPVMDAALALIAKEN